MNSRNTEAEPQRITPGDDLDTQTVASELGVSPKTVTYWRATNQGPLSYKIGGHVRYPRVAFEEWKTRQVAASIRGEGAEHFTSPPTATSGGSTTAGRAAGRTRTTGEKRSSRRGAA
jgi:hypothetical protein